MSLNMETNEDKVYFRPGDCVKLRQFNKMYSPVMYVLRKEMYLFSDSQGGLKGIKCRWFTDQGLLQEAVFSTKDLILVE